MIDKSLANDFQYTKLKYKQYLQFKYTTYVSFMFLFIQFIYQSLFLFCLLKLVLFSKFNSFLPNLLSGEYHKAIYPPHSRNCQVVQKKTRNKIAVLLFLAIKRPCSLLITGRHYSLQVIQISSRSQISRRYTNFQQKSCQCELQ